MKLKASIVMMILFFSVSLFAEMHFVLYGFKIGQNISSVSNQLGKASDVRSFADGFKSYIYKFGNHYAVFETDGTRPDIIWGIQISGKSNPAGFGLNGVNLGDDVKKMIKILGKPDSREQAVDEETGEKIDNTFYHSYLKKGNMSIETADNIVTSIKINFNGIRESSKTFDVKSFIKIVKSGDMNLLAESISSEIAVSKNDKSYIIPKSVYDALNNDEIIKDILFNREYGVIVSEKNCKIEGMLRLVEKGSPGMVFVFTRGDMKYELFFIRSFDGWVLYEVNVL